MDMQAIAAKRAELDALMRRGIMTEFRTGIPYFTGYSYESLYDWDQYFEGIVQLYMGWGTQYLINGVRIFLLNQHEDGFIPRAIDPKGMERSDEAGEMVKPFLCQILLLCLRADGKVPLLCEDDFKARLKKYMNYWMFTLDKRGGGLSYWRSSPHTGMDNQRERAGDWKSDFCEGVDLNAFLCREIAAYAALMHAIGDESSATEAETRRNERANAIISQCWDETKGFFFDVDARTGLRMDIMSVSGFAPMWAGVATQEQAEKMVRRHLMNEAEFARPYPVPAYPAGWKGYEAMYLPGDIGCAWRCNTWIPTNYYVFQGLRNYGFEKEASELARRTYDMAIKAGPREYYASETGEGCGLDPFWGWSLLAYFMPWEADVGFDPTRPETAALKLPF